MQNPQKLTVGLYLFIGLLIWLGFIFTPHDGLANLFLAAYVLPYTLFGAALTRLLGHEAMVLLPTGQSYLVNNALFYFPGLIISSLLLWWLIGKLRR